MYTSIQSQRRWNAAVPLICMISLGLGLFVVAGTVVLSLISLYLPTRNISPVSTRSGPQSITVPLSSNSSVATGPLDSSSQATLSNLLQSAVSGNSAISNNADITLNTATGTSSAGRKRRQNGGTATFVIIIFELIYTKRCITKKCRDYTLASVFTVFSQLQPTIPGIQSNTTNTTTAEDVLTGDINVISQYWGNIRPYQDNADNFFGVKDTGLPLGCQVEQVSVLHRHGARFPASNELAFMRNVVAKLRNTSGTYTGPLSFFNTWTNQLGAEVLLPLGAAMEYTSGVNFWINYGRLLFNATVGQNYYNNSSPQLPLLRGNSIQRIIDSANSWAYGFFALYNASSKYRLLIIPAVPGTNNTLASFVSCSNFLNPERNLFNSSGALYIPVDNYLTSTAARLSQYVPNDVTLSAFDVFNLQYLCTYEYTVFGSSNFCSLFTIAEWKGFQYTVDLFFDSGFSFGSAAGRALGVGYVQELLARLQNRTITQSNTSVNSTLDSSSNTFPLDQQFYLDMTHDIIIVSVLTALSIDYFRENLSPNAYPGAENRHFKSSYVVPYAARLITEKIGCTSPNPTAKPTPSTQYTSTEYGYSAANAPYKFIRMRLNNGILPLDTIRGGYCAGRTDGLCSLDQFVASQANATAEANYGPICFGNYVYDSSQATGDGNYFP